MSDNQNNFSCLYGPLGDEVDVGITNFGVLALTPIAPMVQRSRLYSLCLTSRAEVTQALCVDATCLK
jgi:hypothetical protein